MIPARFLIAKYIEDMRRLEPRNIGVIVWQDGMLAGRFAGEAGGQIKAPRLITKDLRNGYLKVVQSWKLQFDKPHLSIGRGRGEVARSAPEFLSAIRRYSIRNFQLVDGGHAESISGSRDPLDLVNWLYENMVDESGP